MTDLKIPLSELVSIRDVEQQDKEGAKIVNGHAIESFGPFGDRTVPEITWFHRFSTLILDEVPSLLREYVIRRWNISYPQHIWEDTKEMGHIMWNGTAAPPDSPDFEHYHAYGFAVTLPELVTMVEGKKGKSGLLKCAFLNKGDHLMLQGLEAELKVGHVNESKEMADCSGKMTEQTVKITMVPGPEDPPYMPGEFQVLVPEIQPECNMTRQNSMFEPFKNHVTNGDSSTWDISLCLFLLVKSSHCLLPDDMEVERRHMEKIRTLRNHDYGHISSCRMTEEKFDNACSCVRAFVACCMPDQIDETEEAIQRAVRSAQMP